MLYKLMSLVLLVALLAASACVVAPAPRRVRVVRPRPVVVHPRPVVVIRP